MGEVVCMGSKQGNIGGVDADSVLAEVKNKMKKRNYAAKEVTFADVQIKNNFVSDMLVKPFDLEQFKVNLSKMGDDKNVAVYNQQLTSGLSGRIKIFVKQILFKLMRFYVQPIAENQTRYNEECLQAVVQLYTMVEHEKKKEIDAMRSRIEKLEAERKG